VICFSPPCDTHRLALLFTVSTVFLFSAGSLSRALNESKHRTSEDSQPKEDIEETVSTPPEEKEGIEKMMVDYSHNSETAVSVVAADKSLQDNSEAKNE